MTLLRGVLQASTGAKQCGRCEKGEVPAKTTRSHAPSALSVSWQGQRMHGARAAPPNFPPRSDRVLAHRGAFGREGSRSRRLHLHVGGQYAGRHAGLHGPEVRGVGGQVARLDVLPEGPVPHRASQIQSPCTCTTLAGDSRVAQRFRNLIELQSRSVAAHRTSINASSSTWLCWAGMLHGHQHFGWPMEHYSQFHSIPQAVRATSLQERLQLTQTCTAVSGIRPVHITGSRRMHAAAPPGG